MEIQRAVDAILGDDEDHLAALRRSLESDRKIALSLLSVLADRAEAPIREWVAINAVAICGRDAEALLSQLAEDRDADVRMDAMRALTEIDPRWISRFVPRYLKQLGSGDLMNTIDAIWRLVQFREPSALPQLKQLAATGTSAPIRNQAQVAVLVLEGKEETIVDALERHDHERMFTWTKAASYLNTAGARSALERVSRRAPDERCRAEASHALSVIDDVRPFARN